MASRTCPGRSLDIGVFARVCASIDVQTSFELPFGLFRALARPRAETPRNATTGRYVPRRALLLPIKRPQQRKADAARCGRHAHAPSRPWPGVTRPRHRRGDRPAARLGLEVEAGRLVVAGPAHRPELLAIGQGRGEAQRRREAARFHLVHRVQQHLARRSLDRRTGLHAGHDEQEEQLRIRRAAAQVVELVGQLGFHAAAQAREVADLAVVDEEVAVEVEGVAVQPRHPAAGGRPHMGHEEPGAHVGAQGQQVLVAPGRHHLAVDARRVALAIPADAEAVAIGHRLGLLGLQALAHQGMARFADQVFQKDRVARVGQEPAHPLSTSINEVAAMLSP